MGPGATRKIELVCWRERMRKRSRDKDRDGQADRDRETLGDYLEILSDRRRSEYLCVFVNFTVLDLLPCT